MDVDPCAARRCSLGHTQTRRVAVAEGKASLIAPHFPYQLIVVRRNLATYSLAVVVYQRTAVIESARIAIIDHFGS